MRIPNAFFLSALLLALTITVDSQAQADKSSRPSPPATASATVGKLNINLSYSQPAVKGRTIWGVLVPYGKVWRTGANEATTFEVSQEVLVEGQPLPAGKYALFTIPGEEEWTVIFNKNTEQWGAYSYDQGQDALRITVKSAKADAFSERLTFVIEKQDEKAAKVDFSWENLIVGFSVKPAGKS